MAMKRNIYNHERAQRRELTYIRIVCGVGALLAVLAGWHFPILLY